MIIYNDINYTIYNILTLINKFDFLLKLLYNNENVNRSKFIILIIKNLYIIYVINIKMNLLFFEYNTL